jgi:hypothetical protein
VAAMISTTSTCPDCRQPTHRIHGHYQRTLADLPWATAPIELRVIVRRFRCCPCTCRRKTFAERLPTVAPLYARTTTRLTTTQANTGLVLGGAAGSRLLSRHGVPGSRNTIGAYLTSLPSNATLNSHATLCRLSGYVWARCSSHTRTVES